MTEESRNRPELVFKTVGPLLVFAGLIFGVIQFRATAKLDREARKARQNHPNPFNPSTTINFAVPQAGEVKLAIYNLRGQLVQTLYSGVISAGQHSVVWNGTDFRGAKVASGVYVYRLQADGRSQVKKLLLLR